MSRRADSSGRPAVVANVNRICAESLRHQSNIFWKKLNHKKRKQIKFNITLKKCQFPFVSSWYEKMTQSHGPFRITFPRGSRSRVTRVSRGRTPQENPTRKPSKSNLKQSHSRVSSKCFSCECLAWMFPQSQRSVLSLFQECLSGICKGLLQSFQ